MLYYGSKGTLCLYFKGELISSFPLSNKKTLELYFQQGEELIRKSKGVPIKLQIKTYLHMCNMVCNRKKNKQGIRTQDHIFFLNCLFALMRLKIIDNDESNGFMCFNKKK
jgi:hypothetical protein